VERAASSGSFLISNLLSLAVVSLGASNVRALGFVIPEWWVITEAKSSLMRLTETVFVANKAKDIQKGSPKSLNN
jgi:hypothetical protein